MGTVAQLGLAELDAPWSYRRPAKRRRNYEPPLQPGLEAPRAQVIANSPQLRQKLLASGHYLTLLTTPSVNAFKPTISR